MIECDYLPPDNRPVFSDDRALLEPGHYDYIQRWLSEEHSIPIIQLYKRPPFDPFISIEEIPNLTITTIAFQGQLWRCGQRYFHCAIQLGGDMQILGPEIFPPVIGDSRSGSIIGPSPVVDVVIKEADAPPPSIEHLAQLAARVWAGLTDEERLDHEKIGMLAARASMETFE